MQLTSPSTKDIDKAVQILKNGGTVVFPTETSYGLGADATQPRAIKKVYKIKGRNFSKPLSIMVANTKQLTKIAHVTKDSRKLIKTFWPGPLTIILKRKPGLPKELNPKDNTIAVRLPANRVANELTKKLGSPITATSANLVGKGDSYIAKKIISNFKNLQHQPDLVINAGQLPVRNPSTIIDLTVKPYKIIRMGPISPAKIKKALWPKKVVVL